MKTHVEEVALAQFYTQYLYTRKLPFEGLTKEQSKVIISRGRALYHWFKTHQVLHNIISLGVISFLLLGDSLVLLVFPRLFVGVDQANGLSTILVGSLITGIVRGWIIYSLVIYSLHEGAAHKLIFRPNGPNTKHLNWVANNLCRIAGADPVEFAKNHLSHHAHFGTEEDGEFLNFVTPRRYFLTLIPFAMFINFSDFIAHRPLAYTRSQLFSEITKLVYHGLYFYFMAQFFGPVFSLIVLVFVSPHIAFQLDRLRQFSEHNLMPIERQDGARSFGPGFWGLLIGGGSWGQPCHWMHHLIPTIPWYQQIILHYDVAKVLTPQQRKQYLLQPLIGYPRLLWRLWTEPNSFIRGLERSESTGAATGTLN